MVELSRSAAAKSAAAPKELPGLRWDGAEDSKAQGFRGYYKGSTRVSIRVLFGFYKGSGFRV